MGFPNWGKRGPRLGNNSHIFPFLWLKCDLGVELAIYAQYQCHHHVELWLMTVFSQGDPDPTWADESIQPLPLHRSHLQGWYFHYCNGNVTKKLLCPMVLLFLNQVGVKIDNGLTLARWMLKLPVGPQTQVKVKVTIESRWELKLPVGPHAL